MWRCFTRVHCQTLNPGLGTLLNKDLAACTANGVCLVTDNNLITKTDMPDVVKNIIIKDRGKQCHIFSDVSPNPRVNEASNLGAFLREKDINCVIALGGGSVIDCAKAGAMLRNNEGDISTFVGKNQYKNAPCPLIVLPT
eukprot:UN27134